MSHDKLYANRLFLSIYYYDYYHPVQDEIVSEDEEVEDDITESLLLLRAFQDSRFTSLPSEIDNFFFDSSRPGTMYFFNDELVVNRTLIDTQEAPFAQVRGTCIRTGPDAPGDPDYAGLAHCQFVYDIFDDDGVTVIASLAVEGLVGNGEFSTLAITGGTGEVVKAVGQVHLYPAALDSSVSPAAIVRDPTLDFLDTTTVSENENFLAGYDVEIYLWINPSLSAM